MRIQPGPKINKRKKYYIGENAIREYLLNHEVWMDTGEKIPVKDFFLQYVSKESTLEDILDLTEKFCTMWPWEYKSEVMTLFLKIGIEFIKKEEEQTL